MFLRFFSLFEKKYLLFSGLFVIITNGPLVKRLRRRPLTAESGVRFPYGLHFKPHQIDVVFSVLGLVVYNK